MTTATKSIACKLTTLEFRERKATAISELKTFVVTRTELETGYCLEFEVTDEILDKINAFLKTERICCDFLTFELTVHANKALLNITGPEGTKAFLRHEVGL